MSYHRKRGKRGMGDDPNIVCPAGQSPYSVPNLFGPDTWSCAASNSVGGSLLAAGTSGAAAGASGGATAPANNSSGGVWGAISTIFGGPNKVQPVYQASTGPDTTTVLLIGGAALVGLFLVMRN